MANVALISAQLDGQNYQVKGAAAHEDCVNFAGLVSAVIIRATGALGFRFLFALGLLSFFVSAMLAIIAALGLGPLLLTIGSVTALMAVIALHIHQISIQQDHDRTDFDFYAHSSTDQAFGFGA